MAKRLLALLASVVVMSGPALGQPLRMVVVGADAGVAVPPRGAPPVPPPIAALPPIPPAAAPLPLAAGGALAGAGLSASVPLLPVLAAALLGATVPGSGGGGSAPVTTR